MEIHTRYLGAFAILIASTTPAAFAQHPAMPAGMTHEEHLSQMQKDAELKKRGAAAMGFDQDQTTHHFRLYETGGAIEVFANDAADETTLDQVRTHLKDIAGAFARGDFGAPLATHGEMPPGARTMQRLKNAVTFRYENAPAGGRVRITTSDAKAADAVHEFLRYQIREHGTGDPLTIEK